MKKRLLCLAALLAAAGICTLVLLVPRIGETKGIAAYVSSETRLYRSPEDAEPFATIPSGAHVKWISTTEDYAFGYIVAEVEGKTVRAYAPWLSLNITNDNTEPDQAMEYLRTTVGWSEEEIREYQMHTPA